MSTTTNTAHPSALELEAALRLLGYSAGFPPRMNAAARAIDAEACHDAECQACGHPGLEPRPWHKPYGGYYLVACCLACGAGNQL